MKIVDAGFPVLAVSACMLGYASAYDGKSRLDLELITKIKGKILVPVCPEQLGGMSTPRIPSEIQPGRKSVCNLNGEDVTAFFENGKIRTIDIVHGYSIKEAILKDGSPSCGSTWIYDGSFTGVRISGMGIASEYLQQHCIKVTNG